MNEGPPPIHPFPEKKGLPPLAWAGIGCAGILAIGVILMSLLVTRCGMSIAKSLKEHPAREAAAAVAGEYPELEIASENTETGAVTLRLKSSGSEAVTTYDDIAHGRVSFLDSSGNPASVFKGDLPKLPAWVPRYPSASGESSLLHQDLPARVHGITIADTTDALGDVEQFFETEASKLSSSMASSRSSSDINGARKLRLGFEGGKKTLEILAYGTSGSPLTIVTIYTEEK